MVAFLGVVIAAGAMEWALIAHDFSLTYVANNGSRSTPLLYTISSLWGALEGSIILWTLILCGYLVVMVRSTRRGATDALVGWATLVGLAVALYFFGLMAFVANPFKVVAGMVPVDGPGPNPLLQNHPLMAFHPPILYLGYVGFTVPFCYAFASLATRRYSDAWLTATRKAAMVAWVFLTVGVALGGWWSYEVLGWGGYWAWDPVENAAFLPWLTGTAFLHSIQMQERRGMLRVWNISLALATFSLTILGTFLTRSGVIDSVHSFTQSGIGPALLGFLGVVVAASLGMIWWRGDELRSPGRIESIRSRESVFLANNFAFSAFALVVLLGTVYPLAIEALRDRQLSVGEPYFDRMTIPIGLVLVFLMALAPALPWRVASGEVMHQRFIAPGWVGAATMAIAVGLGARGVAQVITFGLGAFAIAGVARIFLAATVARARSDEIAYLRAAMRTLAADPRRYGGLTVHVGVVIVAVALGVSGGYSTRTDKRLDVGDSARVRGFEVTYLGLVHSTSDRKQTTAARIRIQDGSRNLGTYAPSISFFPRSQRAVLTPAVRTGLIADVYLTVVDLPAEGEDGPVTIGVAVNPMVVWLWIGVGVMALGGFAALIPGSGRSRRDDSGRDRTVATTEVSA